MTNNLIKFHEFFQVIFNFSTCSTFSSKISTFFLYFDYYTYPCMSIVWLCKLIGKHIIFPARWKLNHSGNDQCFLLATLPFVGLAYNTLPNKTQQLFQLRYSSREQSTTSFRINYKHVSANLNISYRTEGVKEFSLY